MIYIDKYAYFSGLKDANPLLKILFGGTSLLACVCSWNYFSFAIIFASMFFLTVFRAKIPLGYYFKLLLLPLGFLLFGTVGIVVNISSSTTLSDSCFVLGSFAGYDFFVTPAGLSTGTKLVCKSLSAVSCLYFIILTTPFRDIIYFMQMLKCPKILISLSSLIYQFIFLLIEITDTKLKSQLCRGGYRNFREFGRTFAQLWGSVFIQAYLKSEWTFKSMQSRGYAGELKMTPQLSSGKYQVSFKEITLLSLFFLVVMIPSIIDFFQ